MIATLCHETFAVAQDNMDFDLNQMTGNKDAMIRIYTWQTPGITYPERRPGPVSTWDVDIAHRPTGGGILFHSPGSIVFSIGIPTSQSPFPKSLKATLSLVGRWIQFSLIACGYDVVPDTDSHTANHLYCASYPNPYELRYNGQKVVAMALRRWQSSVLVQGIIHVVSNIPYFGHLGADITPYLSEGLGLSDTPNPRIQAELIRQIPIRLPISIQ